MKNKIVITVISLIIVISFLGTYTYAKLSIYNGDKIPVAEVREDTKNNEAVFPASYKGYIKALKEKHPNWIFKAVYLNVDWNEALRHESNDTVWGISTVPNTYTAAWKLNGTNTYVDGTFVAASKQAIAYTLDPRNSLSESYIFQFKALSYSEEADTLQAVQNVLANTVLGTKEYANKYYNGTELVTMDKTYAEMIRDIGKEVGISSSHLASRIVQETGGDLLNNGSINGKNPNYPGVFNFFNIGAVPNADGQGSVTNGLKYASNQGWTTPEASIRAGAYTLWKDYIQYGQDTMYFEKFDVRGVPASTILFSFQYMTNILSPMSESLSIYKSYKNSNSLDNTYVFYIPVYDNMPDNAAPYPGSTVTETNENGLDIVYLDDKSDSGVTDIFNLRSGPRHSL